MRWHGGWMIWRRQRVDGPCSAEVLAGLQLDYDMTQAMKHAHRINVRRVAAR
jgi:hypothetical protein